MATFQQKEKTYLAVAAAVAALVSPIGLVVIALAAVGGVFSAAFSIVRGVISGSAALPILCQLPSTFSASNLALRLDTPIFFPSMKNARSPTISRA
ncbi:hypothetical protein FACS189427_10620 [Planctomycetales bacterium]|nr:hypothetical protein FACS189427_10620 [Planctomycetales bacterium]